jgi:hypothetical protein
LRSIADVQLSRQAQALPIMDVRFMCETCGTKWFVRVPDDPRAGSACGACGGVLRPLAAPPQPLEGPGDGRAAPAPR